ncbi:MAG TPA: glutamine--fructose-6-phosphate transaminase (isomerizing) [Polyangia bacterium]|jgi:glucosamine--fructose-6-phosphate aminotransferase (isomerizing)|nr:glutamine--fructose-6-phosphate transaminase (isomerizing) [Polyangia bacterium]
MCGIVGYVGPRSATPLLIGGLRRLEYRGYDSAGLAVAGSNGVQVVRCRGKLAGLEALIEHDPPQGTLGIGHTRWATHGRPTESNAHPHKVGPIAVVHNGIIENYLELRGRLESAGRHFSSETDTEIVAHLIDEAVLGGSPTLVDALRVALRQVHGAYALVVISEKHPGQIVAAKHASPMVIGLGEAETFLASDVPAMLEHTRRVIFLEDGDIAEVRAGSVKLSNLAGQPIERPAKTITWDAAAAEKGGYPHFMLKEIHEQPRAIADTLRARLRLETGDADLEGFELGMRDLRRILLIACGTSYHAGLIGKFLIEATSRIPCEVDLASEFRYRDPVVGANDLVIAISQSGETADTLAAVKEARMRGARVLAISNVVDSAIPRSSHGSLYTHAGPEIGVASTKCFTAQLAALALIAVNFGRRTGNLSGDAAMHMVEQLSGIPVKMADALEELGDFTQVAAAYRDARDFLFIGRGTNYPIALEGALKLKEISYIHAEGYAAGEMKHGPIALIDDGVPVVVLAPQGPGYDKVLSNLSEIRARSGHIIAVATRGDNQIRSQCDRVLYIPDAPPALQPFLTVLPLQLMSYAIALVKGNDVDQPRNLAKSVTVE